MIKRLKIKIIIKFLKPKKNKNERGKRINVNIGIKIRFIRGAKKFTVLLIGNVSGNIEKYSNSENIIFLFFSIFKFVIFKIINVMKKVILKLVDKIINGL